MTAVTKPRVDKIRPTELVRLAVAGGLRIPPFQRPFRWETADVVNLFDSILRGYPVGNLLMWQRSARAGTVHLGPLVIDAPAANDALWVVDGQQRVASLVGALAGPADTRDPRFRIYFDLDRERFVSGGTGGRVRDTWLPVFVAVDNTLLLPWQRERSWLTDEQIRRCDEIGTALRDYEIPMYVVTGDDEQALRDIFDRLNNFGKRLKKSEVFQALHAVADQREPSDLAALAANVRRFGYGDFTPDVLMQSLLAGRDARIDRDFHEEFTDEADKHAAFVAVEKSLDRIIEFLRWEVDIPHVRLVPYSLFVPVLARFVALFGPPQGRPAQLLRRWLWRGSALGLPTGTAALRRHAAAVANDPLDSAQRLLDLLPPARDPWQPGLAQVQFNRAQAKLNVLGLLGAHPRLLAATRGSDDEETEAVGGAVDVVELLSAGASPLIPIIPRERASLFGLDPTRDGLLSSVANRIVHPGHDGIWAALVDTPTEWEPGVLGSQCLDARAIELLVSRDGKAFLERRARLVRDQIADHVQRHALFGFRDGPSLGDLFEDLEDVDAA